MADDPLANFYWSILLLFSDWRSGPLAPYLPRSYAGLCCPPSSCTEAPAKALHKSLLSRGNNVGHFSLLSSKSSTLGLQPPRYTVAYVCQRSEGNNIPSNPHSHSEGVPLPCTSLIPSPARAGHRTDDSSIATHVLGRPLPPTHVRPDPCGRAGSGRSLIRRNTGPRQTRQQTR